MIYVLGVTWLAKFVGFESALKTGVLPFILPGLVKTFILASIIRAIRGTLQK